MVEFNTRQMLRPLCTVVLIQITFLSQMTGCTTRQEMTSLQANNTPSSLNNLDVAPAQPTTGFADETEFSSTSWVGKYVFPKESAELFIGKTDVPETLISWPAKVTHVKAGWLWIERGWIRHDQVMDLQEAFDFWNSAVRDTPESAIAYRSRALCWLIKREYPIALKDYNQAIKLSSNDYKALAGRGMTYLEMGMHDEALRDVNAAIKVNGSISYLFALRSRIKRENNDIDGAFADANDAIRIDPTNAKLYASRSEIYWSKDKKDLALADCDEAIRLAPASADSYALRGMLRTYSSDLKVGIRDLSTAIELEPKNPLSWLRRAKAYEESKQFELAFIDIDEALRLKSTDHEILAWRANLRTRTGNLEGAISDYQEAQRLAPAADGLRSAQNQVEEARKDILACTEKLRKNEKDTRALMNRAIVKMNIQYNSGAAEDLERILEIDPNDAWAYCERAGLHIRAEDFALAEKDFAQAIRLNPKETVFLYRRKLLRFSTNDIDGQIADCETLMALKPDDGGLKLEHASLLRIAGRYEEAITELDRLLKIDPDYSPAYINRGIAKCKLGDRAGALRDLKRAKTLGHINADSHIEELGLAGSEP